MSLLLIIIGLLGVCSLAVICVAVTRSRWRTKFATVPQRLRGAPPLFWVIVGILLAVDFWWDLHHAAGFVVDAFLLILIFAYYWRVAHASQSKANVNMPHNTSHSAPK